MVAQYGDMCDRGVVSPYAFQTPPLPQRRDRSYRAQYQHYCMLYKVVYLAHKAVYALRGPAVVVAANLGFREGFTAPVSHSSHSGIAHVSARGLLSYPIGATARQLQHTSAPFYRRPISQSQFSPYFTPPRVSWCKQCLPGW